MVADAQVAEQLADRGWHPSSVRRALEALYHSADQISTVVAMRRALCLSGVLSPADIAFDRMQVSLS